MKQKLYEETFIATHEQIKQFLCQEAESDGWQDGH